MTAAAQEAQWSMMAAAIPARQDQEEAAWVAKARTGDEAAIRSLLSRYRSRAVRLAAQVLRRRPDEAEDVAQEAFVRAFRSLPQLRGDGGFAAWLYRIVLRLCLDRQRASRWRHEIPAADLSEWPFSIPAAGDELETRLLVDALLARLSPPMRAALVLRELEGLDYDEVAQVLGIPVGTVRSRLHTARAQFRDLWVAAQQEEADV